MGKYIKKFDTHSDYEDFIETEDFIRPNVSYCVDNKDVHYNSTQTLFAVEFESGKFAFGHADEDELFVATKDGLAQIWYADANGVITGNTPNADNVASAIIDGYNEHFGTDIKIWTPETITLQVGDTVPNWNAYEKIVFPQKTLIAVKISEESPFANFGYIENNKFYWAGKNNGAQMQQLNATTGYIIGASDFNQTVENTIYTTIRQQYPEVEDIGPYESELGMYQQPLNWSEYEILNPI